MMAEANSQLITESNVSVLEEANRNTAMVWKIIERGIRVLQRELGQFKNMQSMRYAVAMQVSMLLFSFSSFLMASIGSHHHHSRDHSFNTLKSQKPVHGNGNGKGRNRSDRFVLSSEYGNAKVTIQAPN